MLTSQVIITALLLLSIPIILFISPSFFPNHNSTTTLFDYDDPDDLSLFRRASASASPSSRKISHLSFPRKNPLPKIAFLFLTNSNLSFSPLWDRFFSSASNGSSAGHRLFNVYVHADPRCGFSDPLGHFRGRLIPSKHTERASPSLIAATRRLLATAILDDPFNFYFAVVSQHCVPLHSFDYMYGSLFGDPNPNPYRNPLWDPAGFKSFIEVLSDEPNLHERYVARGEQVMLPEVPFERFRVGSQFFILTKRHALGVLEDRKLWRKFRLPCLNDQPCYPEEHYFPTLLNMMDGDNCSGYTLTRVNWTGCYDGHPHVYQPEDVSAELVRNLRQSEGNYSYFFARKFTPECLQPLMDLADDVIFRD